VANTLGFEVPANFLFLVALILLLGVTVHLSWELSRVEEETRSLAEDVALLRADLEQLPCYDPHRRPTRQPPPPETTDISERPAR